MKIVEVTSEHQLPGNLGNNPAAVNLYKECLIQNKQHLLVKVKTKDGPKQLRLTQLDKGIQTTIMQFLHNEALAGRHI